MERPLRKTSIDKLIDFHLHREKLSGNHRQAIIDELDKRQAVWRPLVKKLGPNFANHAYGDGAFAEIIGEKGAYSALQAVFTSCESDHALRRCYNVTEVPFKETGLPEKYLIDHPFERFFTVKRPEYSLDGVFACAETIKSKAPQKHINEAAKGLIFLVRSVTELLRERRPPFAASSAKWVPLVSMDAEIEYARDLLQHARDSSLLSIPTNKGILQFEAVALEFAITGQQLPLTDYKNPPPPKKPSGGPEGETAEPPTPRQPNLGGGSTAAEPPRPALKCTLVRGRTLETIR